mgnify:FL=1
MRKTRLTPGTVFKPHATSFVSLYLTLDSAQGIGRNNSEVSWSVLRGQPIIVLGGHVPNNKRRGFKKGCHTFDVMFGRRVGWMLLTQNDIDQAIIVSRPS